MFQPIHAQTQPQGLHGALSVFQEANPKGRRLMHGAGLAFCSEAKVFFLLFVFSLLICQNKGLSASAADATCDTGDAGTVPSCRMRGQR